MGSRNYVTVLDDLTLSERADSKKRAIAAGIERCAIKNIGDVNSDILGLQSLPEAEKDARFDLVKAYISTGKWPKSLTLRELTPALNGDLVVATALDSWLTAALAVVGTFYTCFQAVVAPQLAQDKLLVCYGISIDSATVPLPVSRVVFRRGGAAGNIIAQYDLEEMEVRQNVDAYFSEPVVIDPQQAFAIQVRCRTVSGAGVAEVVHIHNFLFEQSGLIVT